MILIEKKAVLSAKETEEVHVLWNLLYPASIAHETVTATRYFITTKANKCHYIIKKKGVLVAWSFTFLRNKQRWFSILVHPDYQKQGLGKGLINRMKREGSELCGWMVDEAGYKRVDGEIYRIPLDFYLSLGFIVKENSRFDNDKLRAVKIEWKKS